MSFLAPEQVELVCDLLDGYILTLEDSKRTILDIPELAPVAVDGCAQIDEKILLAKKTRASYE